MKVVIAIDTSPASQRVLTEAICRPWPAETCFSVVNAVDVYRYAHLPAIIADATREAEELVKRAGEGLTRAGRCASGKVITGVPRHAISAYAEEWGADLILVGSHGHSAVGRFLIGSVAQGILRKAPCSVEIVRIGPDAAPSSSHALKVLVATDGSEFSLEAARSITGRPWPVGSIFQVLSAEEMVFVDTPMAASSPSAYYPPSLLDELLTAARARASSAVEATKKILTQAGLHAVACDPAAPGDPRTTILDAAKAWPADLIVLGSHGRSGLDRLLMGSVSEAVAVHANCSVEVIRARANHDQ